MRRLIVMDMDGTLLNEKKQISTFTKKMLIEQEEQGAQLVLASGRGKERLIDYAKELLMDCYRGYLIESNGCSFYDIEQEKRTLIKTMSHEEADVMVRYLRAKYPNNDLVIMGKEHACINTPSSGMQEGVHTRKTIDSLKNRPNKEFKDVYEIKETMYKVCIFDDPQKVEEILRDLQATFGERYWCGRVMPFWIEITPIEINKGNALTKIMHALSIDEEEVYVFGDGENDLSMLAIGNSIAMGNALQNVKAACDYVTSSNEEDGIGKFIKDYL